MRSLKEIAAVWRAELDKQSDKAAVRMSMELVRALIEEMGEAESRILQQAAERAERIIRRESIKWGARMSLRMARHLRRLEPIVRSAILGKP